MSELTVISRDWSASSVYTESRSSLENPQSPLSFPSEMLLDIFNGGRTSAGIRVSEYIAFQVSTFLAGTDIIAGKIASLPRHVYERKATANGRIAHRIAAEHDYYDLLTLEPNPEMNGNTFFKAVLCHAVVWSNAYVEIQRNEGNGVMGLWPRNPAKTKPARALTDIILPPMPWRPFQRVIKAGEMCFETTDGIDDYDAQTLTTHHGYARRFIPAEDVIHIPGISFDGRLGQSIVWLARETLGLALAMEKFGAKYFANYARPGGILTMPAAMTDPQKEQAKRSWREANGGENSNGIAVMPPGWEWKALSNNPQESQTIEARKFSRNEICAILHVPVHMVGGEDKGRSNTEQLAQELKEYCLDPWMSAIKVEVKRKLFPHRGVGRTPRDNFYLDFDLDGMMRPDAASREKFYASGKQWGYLSTNDIHEKEKLNPVLDQDGNPAEWAEEYWMPINMTLTTTPLDPNQQDGAGVGVKSSPKPGTSDKPTKPTPTTAPKSHLIPAYSGMFSRAFTRVCHAETRDRMVFQRHFGPIFAAMKDMLLDEAMREMRMGIAADLSTTSTDKFISQYLGAMQKRGTEWPVEGATDQELVTNELNRVLTGIRIAVYQEVATEKAKLADVDSVADTDTHAETLTEVEV